MTIYLNYLFYFFLDCILLFTFVYNITNNRLLKHNFFASFCRLEKITNRYSGRTCLHVKRGTPKRGTVTTAINQQMFFPRHKDNAPVCYFIDKIQQWHRGHQGSIVKRSDSGTIWTTDALDHDYKCPAPGNSQWACSK